MVSLGFRFGLVRSGGSGPRSLPQGCRVMNVSSLVAFPMSLTCLCLIVKDHNEARYLVWGRHRPHRRIPVVLVTKANIGKFVLRGVKTFRMFKSRWARLTLGRLFPRRRLCYKGAILIAPLVFGIGNAQTKHVVGKTARRTRRKKRSLNEYIKHRRALKPSIASSEIESDFSEDWRKKGQYLDRKGRRRVRNMIDG